jgi:hypothetical protein
MNINNRDLRYVTVISVVVKFARRCTEIFRRSR